MAKANPLNIYLLGILVLLGTFHISSAYVCTLSGTLITGGKNIASNIVTGGQVITITISADGLGATTTFNSLTSTINNAVIDASVATGVDAATWNTNWNAAQKAAANQGMTSPSTTTLTITLAATATYSLTDSSPQNIQFTLPASAVAIGTAQLCTPTLIIYPTTTVALGGDFVTTFSSGDAMPGCYWTLQGLKTITLTLTGDKWVSPFTDGAKIDIINGLQTLATPVPANGWNNAWRPSMSATASLLFITRTSDTLVTIQMQRASTYYIINPEIVSAIMPVTAFSTYAAGSVTAPTTFTVTVPVVTYDLSPPNNIGSFTLTTRKWGQEAAVRDGACIVSGVSGPCTFIISIAADTFLPLTSTVTNKIASGFVSQQTAAQTPGGWNAIWVPAMTNNLAAFALNGASNQITITFPALSSYSISTIETIAITMSKDVISSGTLLQWDIVSQPALTVKQEILPVLTGTLFTGNTMSWNINESRIVAGGYTITITINDDTFVTPFTDTLKQQTIYAATGAESSGICGLVVSPLAPPANFPADLLAKGWQAVVVPGEQTTAAMALFSFNTALTAMTIQLLPQATYNIHQPQTITVTLPLNSINTIQSPTAKQKFTILQTVTIAITGTFVDGVGTDNHAQTEQAVQGLTTAIGTTLRTIVITLTDAQFLTVNPTTVADNSINQAFVTDLINNINATPLTPFVEPIGWNASWKAAQTNVGPGTGVSNTAGVVIGTGGSMGSESNFWKTRATITIPVVTQPSYQQFQDEIVTTTLTPNTHIYVLNDVAPTILTVRIPQVRLSSTASITSTSITTGASTSVITVSLLNASGASYADDHFVSTWGSTEASTFIRGIVSSYSQYQEQLGWDNLVVPTLLGLVATSNPVNRVDANTVTLTIPAIPTYAITFAETLTISIDKTLLISSKVVVCNSQVTITQTSPAAAVVVSGSFVQATGATTVGIATAGSIVSGFRTVTFTLTSTTFVNPITPANQALIIANMISNKVDEPNGWASTVKPLLASPSTTTTFVLSGQNTILSITVPVVPLYALVGASETVSVTIPQGAMNGATSDLTSTNAIIINKSGGTSNAWVQYNVNILGTLAVYPVNSKQQLLMINNIINGGTGLTSLTTLWGVNIPGVSGSVFHEISSISQMSSTVLTVSVTTYASSSTGASMTNAATLIGATFGTSTAKLGGYSFSATNNFVLGKNSSNVDVPYYLTTGASGNVANVFSVGIFALCVMILRLL